MAIQQPNASVYTRSYNSFSGVDMVCAFAGKVIGELQGVSFSVTREKAPLYTMGSADPRSFSRGKRGIAGSLIFLVFDRDALQWGLREAGRFIANAWEVQQNNSIAAGNGDIFANTGTVAEGLQSADSIDAAAYDKVLAQAWYADQVPPFDILITAANEYGHLSRMEIRGVEILNTGSGMSVDDITTDQSCTFVARSIIPWYGQKTIDPVDGRVREPIAGVAPSHLTRGN